MTTREMACVLAVRNGKAGTSVLLEQRAAAQTVMPGLWELPPCSEESTTGLNPIIIVRHAIMQINYTVRVYAPGCRKIPTGANSKAVRRWVSLDEAASMALTGLARKVLMRTKMLRPTHHDSSAAFAAPRTPAVP
jgi:A/G-specific adenine glycosylase